MNCSTVNGSTERPRRKVGMYCKARKPVGCEGGGGGGGGEGPLAPCSSPACY